MNAFTGVLTNTCKFPLHFLAIIYFSRLLKRLAKKSPSMYLAAILAGEAPVNPVITKFNFLLIAIRHIWRIFVAIKFFLIDRIETNDCL